MKKMIMCMAILVLASSGVHAATIGTGWIDQVVYFDRPPYSSSEGGPPENALGPNDDKFVSIDTPETLVLAFVDNLAINGPGNDLRVYEYLNGDSDVQIWAGQDTLNWVFLGTTDSTIEYDLQNYGLDWISHVKFVGLQNGGTYSGYDLDAVFAINSTPVPIPGAVWLLGSGLTAVVASRRRRTRE
ncbi:MAG: hypothetical protein P1P84_11810 [Deferrisomatales bacterium]|nr:hypothetical protein [Deferrisomatales bacterium]